MKIDIQTMIKMWGSWSNMYFIYIIILCFEKNMTAKWFNILHVNISKR